MHGDLIKFPAVENDIVYKVLVYLKNKLSHPMYVEFGSKTDTNLVYKMVWNRKKRHDMKQVILRQGGMAGKLMKEMVGVGRN